MGMKLVKYYNYIKDVKGHPGQIRLALETKIPATVAATQPDTPETVRTFKEAIKKLTGVAPPEF